MRTRPPVSAAGAPALTALLIAACAPAPAPASSGPPPHTAVATFPVSAPGYANETSVAVNPADPSNVAAAWQVPATVGATLDGGATWSVAPLPATNAWQLSGDPAVRYDADGHLYALYIAFDRPDDYDTLGAAAHRNGIFVNRSDDGGRTWRPRPAAVIEQPERPGVPFEDKPMMVADRSDDPARRGNLYVAWTEFRRHQTVILFSRSSDGGRTFAPPLEISDRAGSPKDSVGADEGTDLAVGPDGTVYVVWTDSTGVRLDRSRDGGRTFGDDVLVAATPDIVFGVPGVERANGYPALALDPRSGALYVQWVDGRVGQPAVFLSVSNDGGARWSAPTRVSGDPADDPGPRFFAWLAVDPSRGDLVSGWYHARPDGRLAYVLATSTDGGITFRRSDWSQATFPASGEFLGDYTGVDALDGVAWGAWAETLPEGGAGARGPTRVVVGRARIR